MNQPQASNDVFPERRRSNRITCSRFACSCSLKSETHPEAKTNSAKLGALLLNICPGGVCLETNMKPPRGATMNFRIRPIEGPDLDAKIRILHTRPSSAKGFYILGSEFEEMGEQDRQNLLTLLHMVGRLEKDLAAE
jgi:hypothetical protein